MWIRYLGDHEVDVHFEYRSRDLWGAFPANLCALVEMLYREVLTPNKCEIKRIVDYSDSLHIYENDLDAARKVAPISPMWRNH